MQENMNHEALVMTDPQTLNYSKTDDVLKDIQYIVETSQKAAYSTVDLLLLRRNWLIGKRIAEEELNGDDRAKYGSKVISKISKVLMNQFGSGYTSNALYSYVRFYNTYPDIFYSVSKKSRLLSWTHYRILLQVNDDNVREWYETKQSVKAGVQEPSREIYRRNIITES